MNLDFSIVISSASVVYCWKQHSNEEKAPKFLLSE